MRGLGADVRAPSRCAQTRPGSTCGSWPRRDASSRATGSASSCCTRRLRPAPTSRSARPTAGFAHGVPGAISPHQPAMDIRTLAWTLDGVATPRVRRRRLRDGGPAQLDRRLVQDLQHAALAAVPGGRRRRVPSSSSRSSSRSRASRRPRPTDAATRDGAVVELALVDAGRPAPAVTLGASTVPDAAWSRIRCPTASPGSSSSSTPARLVARGARSRGARGGRAPARRAHHRRRLRRGACARRSRPPRPRGPSRGSARSTAGGHVTEPELCAALADAAGRLLPTRSSSAAPARTSPSSTAGTATCRTASRPSRSHSRRRCTRPSGRSSWSRSRCRRRWCATPRASPAGRPLHVGPVTLRSRFNAVATSAAGPADPTLAAGYGAELVAGATDARQSSDALAAWTVASYAAIARRRRRGGVATWTTSRAWGPRGIRRLGRLPGRAGRGCSPRSPAARTAAPLGPAPDGVGRRQHATRRIVAGARGEPRRATRDARRASRRTGPRAHGGAVRGGRDRLDRPMTRAARDDRRLALVELAFHGPAMPIPPIRTPLWRPSRTQRRLDRVAGFWDGDDRTSRVLRRAQGSCDGGPPRAAAPSWPGARVYGGAGGRSPAHGPARVGLDLSFRPCRRHVVPAGRGDCLQRLHQTDERCSTRRSMRSPARLQQVAIHGVPAGGGYIERFPELAALRARRRRELGRVALAGRRVSRAGRGRAALAGRGIEADMLIFNATMAGNSGSTRHRGRGCRLPALPRRRLSAYPNVWWSLCNEFDKLEGLLARRAVGRAMGALLAEIDPHEHLSSIHNWMWLYDNNRPWVTHASIQNGSATHRVRPRERCIGTCRRKPVVLDEIKYEGDIPERWGHLEPRQLVHQFWIATVAGCYASHGESFPTDERQPAHGRGRNAARRAPGATGLPPRDPGRPRRAGLDPIDNVGRPGVRRRRPGEQYVQYFGRSGPASWAFRLPQGDQRRAWSRSATVRGRRHRHVEHDGDAGRPRFALDDVQRNDAYAGMRRRSAARGRSARAPSPPRRLRMRQPSTMRHCDGARRTDAPHMTDLTSPVDPRPLGGTATVASPITLGTSGSGGTSPGDPQEAEAIDLASAMLRGPYALVDTSNKYAEGRSEAVLGAALARDGIAPGRAIVSKVDRDVATGVFDRDRVRRSFDESCERLGVDRLGPCTCTTRTRCRSRTRWARAARSRACCSCATRAWSTRSASPPARSASCGATSARASSMRALAQPLHARRPQRDAPVRGGRRPRHGRFNAAPFGGGLLARGSASGATYAYAETTPELRAWVDGLRRCAPATAWTCRRPRCGSRCARRSCTPRWSASRPPRAWPSSSGRAPPRCPRSSGTSSTGWARRRRRSATDRARHPTALTARPSPPQNRHHETMTIAIATPSASCRLPRTPRPAGPRTLAEPQRDLAVPSRADGRRDGPRSRPRSGTAALGRDRGARRTGCCRRSRPAGGPDHP